MGGGEQKQMDRALSKKCLERPASAAELVHVASSTIGRAARISYGEHFRWHLGAAFFVIMRTSAARTPPMNGAT